MKLKYLIIHCTATPEGREVSKKDIEYWHKVGRGWSRVGYSDLIHLDGEIENLTPYDGDENVDYHEATWGAKGFNWKSRHVVYAGGCELVFDTLTKKNTLKPKDTRTKEQYQAIANYCRIMAQLYPDIKIIGHNQTAAKACPSFDVPSFLRSINLEKHAIDGKIRS